MKRRKANVIIFHGTMSTPSSYWYKWLASEVKKQGADAQVPEFRKINVEPIERTVERVFDRVEIDENTILVGHSAGAPLILSVLERLEKPVRQSVLVAGPINMPGSRFLPVLQQKYDWEKIKANAGDVVIVNSVNDQFGCDDKQGRAVFDKLGGTLIIKNEGHFGTVLFLQKCDEFPFLLRLLDL
ncbi:alpha/beta hydrolase [Candidatus Saccharibacteria bacterium]|nr:alpha/beta hydrolase [Candidatus Saccharibacteria bacterium]